MIVRALSAAQCAANIKAQATKELLKQPRQQTLVVRDSATRQVLDVERDTELYLEALTRSNLDKATLLTLRRCGPSTRGSARAAIRKC